MLKSDDSVETDVIEALYRDGGFDPRQVAVSVLDGVATLRGTVGSQAQKRAAAAAAQRVDGVAHVHDELRVQQQGLHARLDAELRADVLQALGDDPLVPETVDADAGGGVVTLTGSVLTVLERDRAEELAAGVRGVRAVRNELTVDAPKVWP